MRTIHSSSKVTELKLTQDNRGSSPYRTFIKKFHPAKTPLSLAVNFENMLPLAKKSLPVGDLLCTEIDLWADVLGPRTLAALTVFRPYLSLEAFEFTRVMHAIASRFSMLGEPGLNHKVIAGLDETSQANLALIKGLGFNCYQLLVSNDELNQLPRLQRKIGWLRDYAIECVGIQLRHTDCLSELRESIKQINVECQPDYICTGSEGDVIDIMSTPLRESMLAEQVRGIDFLELGLEGASTIDDETIQNYCSIDKYLAALEVGRLPIHIHR